MTVLPRTLCFHSRGRVDAEPLRRVLEEGSCLVASRAWWCGAPVLSEDKKTPSKVRARIRGEIDVCFGWQDGDADRRWEDDAFMGGRDARFVVEVLRRWSIERGITWEVALPEGSEATISGGVVETPISALLDAWADAGRASGDEVSDEARASGLLLRHAHRHRGLSQTPWTSMGVVARMARIAELAAWAQLEPEAPAVASAIEDEIRRRRSVGQIWFGVYRPTLVGDWNPRALADRITSGLGLGLVGADWQELSRNAATALISYVLQEELAYNTPLIPAPEARALAEQFLALFPEDAQFFTNGVWHDGGITGWYAAVAPSTLEGGVVVVSRTRAGILWAGDED